MKKLLPLLLCLALFLSLSAPARAVNSPSQPTPTPAPTPEPDPVAEFCAETGLTLDDLQQIYSDVDAALHSPELDALYYSPDYDPDEYDAAEAAALQTVADAHKLTAEQAKQVYYWGLLGELSTFDTSAVSLKYGDLLDVTAAGRVLIVKAKIRPSLSNELTVNQNYHNAWHIIHEFAGQEFPFDELQYWAVADMTDGSEGKVISFTVPAPIIEHILAAEYDFADIDLAAAVTDLWILPSLR